MSSAAVSRSSAAFCLRVLICLGLVASGVALVASPVTAQVVARVNGVEITEQDMKLAQEDIGSGLSPQMTDEQRRTYLLNYLIDMKLAARQAEADKLAETAEVQRKMAYFRQKALMQGLLDKIRDAAVTDDALKKVYDDAAKSQGTEEEVNASHILVATQEEALAALKRVRGGEDFAKVAKEVSKDPGSPGGALGWFTKDRMVPAFAEVAFKTPKGTISEPVQSQFGWHIIRVEDKRSKEFPPFSAVRDQIVRFVARRAHAAEIEKLRAAAKIERLGAAATAVPGPSPSQMPAPK